MKEYYVIQQTELIDLMNETNRLIQKGWIPQGGASKYSMNGKTMYLQAMVYPKS